MLLVQSFDNYVLGSIRKHVQSKYLDRIMPIITSMGNLGFVWIVIAVFLIFHVKYRIIGSIVILTLITSTGIGEGIIKHIVKRVRPCNQKNIALLIPKPVTYSFPSGHTLSSFAVAEMLSLFFTRYRLIFIGIAVLIAFSRLYLYVHYPSDVIAGVIIGILCSKLIFIAFQKGYLLEVGVLLRKFIMKV